MTVPSEAAELRAECSAHPITRLLESINAGQATAERLLPLIYHELRRLAARRLKQEPAGHTLQPTALVHEAYLRLVGDSPSVRWDSRGHFFSAAAEAMRRILVENARRKLRIKHGGGRRREVAGDRIDISAALDDERLLALSDILERFGEHSPEKAQLVKLRYFAGLSEAEAAAILGISRATAARWWAYSKAWLFDQLGPQH